VTEAVLATPAQGIAPGVAGGPARPDAVDLTVLIQGSDEASPLDALLSQLATHLARLAIEYEVIVLTHGSGPRARAAAEAHRARVIEVPTDYGTALIAGLTQSSGTYVLTMDADLSHPPDFVERLWADREKADITIASRYVDGGAADVGAVRYAGSRVLNTVFGRGLDLPIRDMSSGFRLYRAAVIRAQHLTNPGLDILQQILVQAFAEGWRVREAPFTYRSNNTGISQRRLVPMAWAWMRTFGAMWKLRNSILSADYDDRAHDSRIPLQRYWQRTRRQHVLDLIAGEGPVLDVGCGSSRIIAGLPVGSIAVDILQRKLRYARRFQRPLARASGDALPFPDASFPCVLCSQLIEHVPKDAPFLDELCRVLAPGGRLVLGTPDYDNWQWVYIEKLYGLVPGGYKDEHISHYSNRELRELMSARGLRFEEERYILRGELIQAYRKPAPALVQ
jgi:dolichol-phosphate mannosyltransferase